MWRRNVGLGRWGPGAESPRQEKTSVLQTRMRALLARL